MESVVNAGGTHTVTVACLDKDGNPTVPLSASYQIHDADSGQAIRGATALTPATNMDINLTASDNTLVNSLKVSEERVLTVSWVNAGGESDSAEYRWQVRKIIKA